MTMHSRRHDAVVNKMKSYMLQAQLLQVLSGVSSVTSTLQRAV